MTVEGIVETLKAEITSLTGFPAFLLPQKSTCNTAHIDLLFQSILRNGEDNERLTFSADYRTAGTHARWLTETVRLSRKLDDSASGAICIPLTVDSIKLRAYWIRSGKAQWVYPSEDEKSMPAEYVIPGRIEIDIPTRLLEDQT